MNSITQVDSSLEQEFEGERFTAYQDIVGVWTIGYGHTYDVKQGMTSTHEDNLIWLQEDLDECIREINRDVIVPLIDNEMAALADFIFNLGPTAFRGSTLLKKLNTKDYDGAANELLKWDHAGAIAVAGLLRRRNAELIKFKQVGAIS